MHRVFHPMCGATLPVLLGQLARGDIAPSRAHVAAIALAMATLRAPFTVGEAAYTALRAPRPGRYPAPVFIIGHWRSGTTHLANLLSRGGAFGILSPMSVGLPAEALGLARVARPFVDQFFPPNRIIDDMALLADLPQEDELAMANLSTLSSQHGITFPCRLHAEFDRALFGTGVSPREQARWARIFERYVAKLTHAAGNRPLLIRNPASSTRIAALRGIWPDARFIHIHREPAAVLASSVRMFATLLRELAIGRCADPDGAARALVLRIYPRVIAALLEAPGIATVAHADLERDPQAVLGRLHAELHLPRTEAGVAAMARYAATHRRVPRPAAFDGGIADLLCAHATILARLGYGAAVGETQAPGGVRGTAPMTAADLPV